MMRMLHSMVPPGPLPGRGEGANRAPSRVAWLDRRVTKRRRPAINKEDINPNNQLSIARRVSHRQTKNQQEHTSGRNAHTDTAHITGNRHHQCIPLTANEMPHTCRTNHRSLTRLLPARSAPAPASNSHPYPCGMSLIQHLEKGEPSS